MNTLYISDLDGTLLDGGSLVSPRSRELLKKAIGEGALFTVATARTPATVSRLLEGIPVPLPAIVMTGAALWNPRTGEYSSVSFHSEETARRLLGIYLESDLPPYIYTLRDGVIHIYHPGPLTDLEKRFMEERLASPFKRFHIGEVPESLDNVLLFYSMRPKEVVAPVYEKLRHEDCNPFYYFDMFGRETAIMEVFSRTTSKANAMRRIAEIAGADRIVAYGDNVNDLPMLRAATEGVAVANAIEDVRREASRIIGKNTEDAVPLDILDDMKKQ